jgi:REP element-mobilizing transposase RayT
MTYNDLRTGRTSRQGGAYHVVATTLDRTPVFSDLYNGRVVVEALMRLQREGVADTLCYVVMPDHVHWLFVLGASNLPAAVGRMKARVTQRMGEAVWQTGFFDRAVRREDDIRDMARYIVANPLRAGLVTRLGDYALWDAIWV